MEVVPAQGSLLERVLDETCPFFGDGLDRPGFAKWEVALMKSAWGRKSRRRLALVHGGDLLASAVQYDLTGTLDGRTVRICGLGSVYTDAPHRGRGHAQVLVEKVLDHAAQLGAEIALLLSRPGCNDETDLGSGAFPSIAVTLRVTESSRRGAPMTMVRGGEERDLPAVVAMGRVRAEPFRFHLDRDVDLLQYAIIRKRLAAGLGPAGARQLQFFIAEEGTTAAAYIILSVIGRTWTVEECGDRDPAGARVGALLQALIAREPAEHRPTIQASLPHAFLPPQVTVVSSIPSADNLRLRLLTAAAAPLSRDDVLYWPNDVF